MCAVKLHLIDSQALIIIGAYRPPNRDALYAQNLFDTECTCQTDAQHILEGGYLLSNSLCSINRKYMSLGANLVTIIASSDPQ